MKSFDFEANFICVSSLYFPHEVLNIRAGSVLTETEEPAVFDDFLRTETEIKPISKKIGNQTRTGTELENRG